MRKRCNQRYHRAVFNDLALSGVRTRKDSKRTRCINQTSKVVGSKVRYKQGDRLRPEHCILDYRAWEDVREQVDYQLAQFAMEGDKVDEGRGGIPVLDGLDNVFAPNGRQSES
jgi:hypothetical protein